MSFQVVRGLGPFLRVAIYAALLLGLGHFLIYGHSAEDPWEVFGEDGRIEVAQVVLLGLGFALSVLMAATRARSRPLSVLLAGFLAAMIVREHNNYFKDHVGDNVWQAIVGFVLVVTLAIAWRWRKNLGRALLDLVSGPAFGWLSAGVLLTLFGQLTDEVELWDFLLGEGYPYAARRSIEECFELVGIYFFLVGLLEHYLALGRPASRPEDVQPSSA